MHKQQNDGLEEQAERSFQERILGQLKAHHAELVDDLDDDYLAHMVRVGVNRARTHDFTWETTISSFVALMFEMAPNFDDHPACKRILENTEMDEEKKIDTLVAEITESDWEEIQESYDDKAWRFVE